MRDIFNPTNLIFSAIAALIILPVHEWAHAFTAYKLGDNTAYRSGRLTLNPLSHLDPIGFICLVVFGFGWAKPVPINPGNFKNYRKGMAITAAAGPISNFILSYLVLILYKVFFGVVSLMNIAADTAVIWGIGNILRYIILISIGLGVFNLIPIPPLDGSRIADLFLPRKWRYFMAQYQMYFSFALLALLYLGSLNGILSTVQMWILNLLNAGTGFVDAIFRLF